MIDISLFVQHDSKAYDMNACLCNQHACILICWSSFGKRDGVQFTIPAARKLLLAAYLVCNLFWGGRKKNAAFRTLLLRETIFPLLSQAIRDSKCARISSNVPTLWHWGTGQATSRFPPTSWVAGSISSPPKVVNNTLFKETNTPVLKVYENTYCD